jgi:hypothetical protein
MSVDIDHVGSDNGDKDEEDHPEAAAAAAAGGGAAASSRAGDEDNDNGKGRDDSSAADIQSLLCREQLEKFSDSTLFRRLVEPSTSSAASGVAAAAASDSNAAKKRALTQHPYPHPHPPPPPPHGHNNPYPYQHVHEQLQQQFRGSGGISKRHPATAEDGGSEPPPAPPLPAKKRPAQAAPRQPTFGAASNAAGAAPPAAAVPPPYMRSWHSLGLGTARGSGAWNRMLRHALREQSNGHWSDAVPQLTPHEVLDVVRCRCRLRTVCPPPNNNNSNNNSNGNSAGGPFVRPLPPRSITTTRDDPDGTKSGLGGVGDGAHKEERAEFARVLSDLYGTMVAQDAVSGHERYVAATSDDVLQKMRHIENDHSRLQLRQERVLALSKQVGLLTPETRIESLRMRGIVVARNEDEDGNDAVGIVGADNGGATTTSKKKANGSSKRRRDTYWRQDFEKLLEERRRADAAGTFLFAHDAY